VAFDVGIAVKVSPVFGAVGGLGHLDVRHFAGNLA
jgi:hypothetical protein